MKLGLNEEENETSIVYHLPAGKGRRIANKITRKEEEIEYTKKRGI